MCWWDIFANMMMNFAKRGAGYHVCKKEEEVCDRSLLDERINKRTELMDVNVQCNFV